MAKMNLLICGDRHWTNRKQIADLLAKVKDQVEAVIEGGARGADTLAKEAAMELNISVREFPAEWERYGRAAGPMRNTQMLEQGKPDMVWAFHNNLQESRGTKDMVRQAKARKIPTMVFSVRGTEVIVVDGTMTFGDQIAEGVWLDLLKETK